MVLESLSACGSLLQKDAQPVNVFLFSSIIFTKQCEIELT